MKGFKGFDKDMKCRGFQYSVGESYETEKEYLDSYYTSDRRERSLPIVGCAVVFMVVVAVVWFGVWVVGLIF